MIAPFPSMLAGRASSVSNPPRTPMSPKSPRAARSRMAYSPVSPLTGLVRFKAGHVPGAGQELTAGFEFDVPVRFDTGALEINLAAFEAGDIPDIPIVEIRA